MNLFIVHYDPFEAAKMLPDKLVVKMPLEVAQLLCTAHRVIDDPNSEGFERTATDHEQLYKKTHQNHPCGIWVRGRASSYAWAWSHMQGLLDEYQHRYGRQHKIRADGLEELLRVKPHHMDDTGEPISLHDAPLCMPDEFKLSPYHHEEGHLQASYQNYLANGKDYTKYGEGYRRCPTGVPLWVRAWQKLWQNKQELLSLQLAYDRQEERLYELTSMMISKSQRGAW